MGDRLTWIDKSFCGIDLRHHLTLVVNRLNLEPTSHDKSHRLKRIDIDVIYVCVHVGASVVAALITQYHDQLYHSSSDLLYLDDLPLHYLRKIDFSTYRYGTVYASFRSVVSFDLQYVARYAYEWSCFLRYLLSFFMLACFWKRSFVIALCLFSEFYQ